MLRFLASRLLHALATLLVAVSLVFLAVRALPGNPLIARFGQHADEQQIEQLRKDYGWDRPLTTQLGEFLWKLMQGDLGKSLVHPGVIIREQLSLRVPATAELTLVALLVAIPVGIGTGLVAAIFRGRWPDRLATVGSLVGVSVPVFFLGIIARLIFSGLPTSQRFPPTNFEFLPLTGLYLLDTLLRGRLDWWLLAAKHLLLPALVLSTIPAALIAKITRSSMLDVLGSDYIRTARAKGAGLWQIVWRHAFPNAAVPIVNITGLQVGLLLSGAVLTETVFDWPGLGKYLTAAVRDRDYMAVQGGALVVAAIFITLNLALDLVYGLLDPRIHHAQGAPMNSPALRALYRNPAAWLGGGVVALVVLTAAAAPLLAPYGPDVADEVEATPREKITQPPTRTHWLGTDSLRKDVFSRVLYGSRLSLTAAGFSILLAIVIGLPCGALAGYCGGVVDSLLMRGIDVALAFPSVLIALLVATALRPGWIAVILAVGLINVPVFARQIRASVLTVRNLDYVLASRAFGATPWHILSRTILPALVGPTIVLASLLVGSAILEVAGLSFLGIGGDPTQPEWGSMLAQAKEDLGRNAWFAAGPGLAISLTVLGCNLLGDALRDALEPK